MMRTIYILLTALTILVSACTTPVYRDKPERFLFVGNSLTYYGNLPAVFDSLSAANGHATSSDMIVQGGATLSQRVVDGSVVRALKENSYDVVVLQERGGNLMCGFAPVACEESRTAIQTLTATARKHGARIVLMGTYQGSPAASRRLVEMESLAARKAGIPYVEVYGKLQKLLRDAPEMKWFAADGVHPGKHLVLLDAVLLYQTVLKIYPQSRPFDVHAPIYGSHSGLTASLRPADTAPPDGNTADHIHYAREEITKLFQTMSEFKKD